MPETVRLSRPARARRTAFTLAVASLLTAGTFWGDDDAYPFGPFRMFSTATKPSGSVTAMALEARSADGPYGPVGINPWTVGVNRAEVEGQIPQITANPAMLGMLARAHDTLQPGRDPWEAVRLVKRQTVLVDRVPTGETIQTVLAEWSR